MSSPPPKVHEPTDEQLKVLVAPDRIRVVRACPGAGKTEMFVEAIRRRLTSWNSPTTGLAALSFTNVARQTIENRVGGVVTAPHFVGTLDSFIFRFVVKPFGHLSHLPNGKVRLFPAVKSNQLESPSVQIGASPKLRAPLTKVHFCGVRDGLAYARADTPIGSVDVPKEQMISIRKTKEEFWKKTGIVTHSDCHFLAALILYKNGVNNPVRKVLARRFPVLFIDELQDTGHFLSRAFADICKESAIEALVVGDPNQAIYSFGGASPTIFDDFESLDGAKRFSLTRSQRCPKRIAKVVSALSYSQEPVEARSDAVDGDLSLVVHTLEHARLNPPQAAFLRSLIAGKKFAVIARRGDTATDLRGQVVRDEFEGTSNAARKINRAVQFFLGGDALAASQIVERELYRIVFSDPKAGEDELAEKGISKRQWRSAIYLVLTQAALKVEAETWNDWVKRLKVVIRDACLSVGWVEDSAALMSYKICKTDGIKPRSPLLDVPMAKLWADTDTVTTIHKVKGDEFDTVVVFTPKPSKGVSCPAKKWWSPDEGGEEQRVAFVAASRAKKKLILCIHEKSLTALKESRGDFVAMFGEPLILPG